MHHLWVFDADPRCVDESAKNETLHVSSANQRQVAEKEKPSSLLFSTRLAQDHAEEWIAASVFVLTSLDLAGFETSHDQFDRFEKNKRKAGERETRATRLAVEQMGKLLLGEAVHVGNRRIEVRPQGRPVLSRTREVVEFRRHEREVVQSFEIVDVRKDLNPRSRDEKEGQLVVRLRTKALELTSRMSSSGSSEKRSRRLTEPFAACFFFLLVVFFLFLFAPRRSDK